MGGASEVARPLETTRRRIDASESIGGRQLPDVEVIQLNRGDAGVVPGGTAEIDGDTLAWPSGQLPLVHQLVIDVEPQVLAGPLDAQAVQRRAAGEAGGLQVQSLLELKLPVWSVKPQLPPGPM